MPEVAKANIKLDSNFICNCEIQCYCEQNSVYCQQKLLSIFILDSFTNEDSTKLEEITTSVLKPTKNREESKERVKKYLQWVRTITANNRFFLPWNERLV